MTASIHPTAIVDRGAELGTGASIGPYCCIGPEVKLGPGVVLQSHVVVAGRTSIGEGTRIFPFASIGQPPQDKKFSGERTELFIGRHNVIREGVTMNPGTAGGAGVTRVGDHGLFMAASHVAHDCLIGDHVIFANCATLGGHVEVGDYAILGGLSAVHQFVRIGQHAMIGGMSGVEQDVIPYGSVLGNRAHLAGLNLVGLKRRGFPRDDIHRLRQAFRLLFGSGGTLQERLDAANEQFGSSPLVAEVVGFISGASRRGLCQPEAGAEADAGPD